MPMQPSSRVQGNIVNRYERRFLDWACARMPARVTSDHLTAFGVLGAFLVVGSYLASRFDTRFLWLAAIGYVIHWFGDSLDGSLARYRRNQRPRYGYFLDHSVDALCILLMLGGMGLTAFVRLDVALFVVVGYFALSIHVFLKDKVTETFQLSFMALGPTELRITFTAITLWMYVCGASATHFPGSALTDYDVALLVIGGVFLALFAINSATMILRLRSLEGDGRRRPAAPEQARAMPAPRNLRGDAAEPFQTALSRRSIL